MISHIKIVAPGWGSYNGEFSTVEFENGVSKYPLTRHLIDRVSCLVQTELCDETGASTGEQAGEAARMVAGRAVPAIQEGGLAKATPEELAAEKKADQANSGIPPVGKYYTQEELEILAGREGINGLRAIGGPWGVKDRSIEKLIALILQAQSTFKTKLADKNAEVSANRKAALADALAKRQAEEDAISAKARDLTAEAAINVAAANVKAALEAAETAKVAADAKSKAEADANSAAVAAGMPLPFPPTSPTALVTPDALANHAA